MKKKICCGLIGCLLGVCFTCRAAESEYAPGELIVKYTERISVAAFDECLGKGTFRSHPDTLSIAALHQRYHLKRMTQLIRGLQHSASKTGAGSRSSLSTQSDQTNGSRLQDIYLLTFENGSSDMEILAMEYAQNSNVEYACPNYLWQVAAIPNDSNYTQQWAHQNLNSENGWDLTTGDTNITIAVIDTGVDWDHPDLAANIWVNSAENSTNGMDDDANGYIDDIRGWDFVDVTTTNAFAPGEDIGPPDNDPMDFYGHGTVVAGVAAAVGSNGLGIAGTSWRCKIMPLRVGIAERDSGNAYILSSWIANATYYAANNGADIINLSLVDNNWPGTGSGPTKDAIDYAYAQDVVIVASAGNYGTDGLVYPAAYEKVIGVAATDQLDQRSVWGSPQPPLYQGVSSSYGTWVSVAAPGTDILTTGFDNTYETRNGTSLSAPFVSGLAALVRSIHPGFNNAEVMKVIYSTTDQPDSEKYIGSGRINAFRALGMTAVPVAEITAPVQEQVIGTNINVVGSVGGTNFSSYALHCAQGIYPASWSTIASDTQEVTNGVLGVWDVSSLQDNAIHTLRLSVTG